MKKAIILSAICFLFLGCYGSEKEIILASEAVQVPGVTGTYQNGVKSSSGNVMVQAVPGSNDYRFQETFEGGNSDSGYIRFIPLTGNIYIGQFKYDNDPWYYIQFFRIDGSSYKELFLTEYEYDNIGNLASSYNIKLQPDMETDFVDGKRTDILAFLRAHANLSFE